MDFKLLYGDREVSFSFPDDRIKGVLEGRPLPNPLSEEELVKEALAHPLDSAPLSQIVRAGETACIIVGDMTRVWVRHHVLMPFLLNELNKGGIPDKNICIISATGDHRPQTAEEHRKLVGEEAYNRVEVIDHQARKADEMVFLGTTSYGTPVSINRRVAQADRVILTGGIVYHFLAGWGGGKKAVIPGVAAYETIMKNHSLAFLPDSGQGLNPSVCAGSITGNPCADDMVQGASMANPVFLVNTIINEEVHKIAKVVAGNWITAYQTGCRYVDDLFRVQIEEMADLTIASCGGYPKDINFYQTYKTIYNAHFTLNKGGTLILLSESREGLGNSDFAGIFTAYNSNPEREAAMRKAYTIGGHMGYHTTVISEDFDVLALTGLPEADVRSMGMIPIKSLDEALNFVRNKHGEIPPAYIMPHAGSTFPCLKGCS